MAGVQVSFAFRVPSRLDLNYRRSLNPYCRSACHQRQLLKGKLPFADLLKGKCSQSSLPLGIRVLLAFKVPRNFARFWAKAVGLDRSYA